MASQNIQPNYSWPPWNDQQETAVHYNQEAVTLTIVAKRRRTAETTRAVSRPVTRVVVLVGSTVSLNFNLQGGKALDRAY